MLWSTVAFMPLHQLYQLCLDWSPILFLNGYLNKTYCHLRGCNSDFFKLHISKRWPLFTCWQTFHLLWFLHWLSALPKYYVQLLSCWVLYQDFLKNCGMTVRLMIFFERSYLDGGKKISLWKFTTSIQPIFSLFSSKSKLHGAHLRIQVLLLSIFAPQHTSVHLIFLNSHSSANWVTLQVSTKQYNVTICERHRLIYFAQAGLCPAGPSACRLIKVLVGKVPRQALFDTLWLFNQTLNRAQKWFKSIFNPKFM